MLKQWFIHKSSAERLFDTESTLQVPFGKLQSQQSLILQIYLLFWMIPVNPVV